MSRARVTSTCAVMLAAFVLGGCRDASTPDVAPPSTTGVPPQPAASDPTLPAPAAGDAATPAAPATSPGGATVQITYARWSAEGDRAEVGAILPGLVEDGGTCTLTLAQGDVQVSATSAASASASSTSCAEMNQPGLSHGAWTGAVRYDSPTTTAATAATVTIEVP